MTDPINKLRQGALSPEDIKRLRVQPGPNGVHILGQQQTPEQMFRQLVGLVQQLHRELGGDHGPPIPRGFVSVSGGF